MEFWPKSLMESLKIEILRSLLIRFERAWPNSEFMHKPIESIRRVKGPAQLSVLMTIQCVCGEVKLVGGRTTVNW
jgi:hypothetical protein